MCSTMVLGRSRNPTAERQGFERTCFPNPFFRRILRRKPLIFNELCFSSPCAWLCLFSCVCHLGWSQFGHKPGVSSPKPSLKTMELPGPPEARFGEGPNGSSARPLRSGILASGVVVRPRDTVLCTQGQRKSYAAFRCGRSALGRLSWLCVPVAEGRINASGWLAWLGVRD